MSEQANTAAVESGGKRRRLKATRHESFLRHADYRYAKIAGALSLAALLGYLVIEVEPRHNGGSWYGYLLGTVGAGLIVWLTLLGLRKRLITPGRWSLKGWTSAHVYLGLSLIVIGTLHTGFQFGWNVHTLAYVLMLIVIISGIFGIYFYARIPRLMSDNRAETSQVEMIQEIDAIDRELRETARPLDEADVADVERAVTATKLGGGLMTRLSGFDRTCATARALRRLRDRDGDGTSDMRAARDAVIGLLVRKTVLLERTRRHIAFRTVLELWLYVHVPVTFALLAALTVHIVSVFFYW